MTDRIERWRLILGRQADPQGDTPLSGQAAGIDSVLEALYDSDRKGGLGSSSPSINRWLGDVRKYFPTPVVQLIQKDAFERLNLQQLLMEPELLNMLEPDASLVATLVSLSKVMPARTRETAREVVRKVVRDLEMRLRNPLQAAISGSLCRSLRNRRPRYGEIDWHRTIRANLRHYQPSLKTIVPEQLHGFGKRRHAMHHIILLADQSGSMATSVVYAGIMGAVMASLRSVKTRFVAFDTAVADLSERLQDSVELLFGLQLGGGTDIAAALAYTQKLVEEPAKTTLLLISDLFEGGSEADLLRRMADMKSAGVRLVVLLALNDEGMPAYDHATAARLAVMDIPALACTPDQFPALMTAVLKDHSLRHWAGG